jgi:hypothetical protein
MKLEDHIAELERLIRVKRASLGDANSIEVWEALQNQIYGMETVVSHLRDDPDLYKVKEPEVPKLKGTAYREAMNQRAAKKALATQNAFPEPEKRCADCIHLWLSPSSGVCSSCHIDKSRPNFVRAV